MRVVRWCRSALLLLLLAQLAGCVHRYRLPPPAAGVGFVMPGTLVLVAAPDDGQNEQGKVYFGSGRATLQALGAALRERGVQADELQEPILPAQLLGVARSTSATYLVVPEIRIWSDHSKDWSGVPNLLTIRIRVIDVASGATLDDRAARAESRWMVFWGDNLPRFLTELSRRWAASVVARPPDATI